MFRSGLAFGGVRVRCLCVRCVLCLVCLPLRVRPRVCPVLVLRFCNRYTHPTQTLPTYRQRQTGINGYPTRQGAEDLQLSAHSACACALFDTPGAEERWILSA